MAHLSLLADMTRKCTGADMAWLRTCIHAFMGARDMHRNFRFLKLLAWMLLCIAQGLWSLPSQAAARTVLVGIFPKAGFHSLEDDRPVGYDIDYLEQVSRYTGWQIKFVNLESWHHALDALEKNQIDLVGGALHTPERAKRFLYCPYSSGITYTALVTSKDTDLIYEDFKKFENLRIGVTSDSPWRADFIAYASRNNFIAPQLVPFDLAEDSRAALQAGEIDAILTSAMRLNPGETVLAKYDPTPFFYITSLGNTHLMKELEYGIGQIKLEQPDLENKLSRTHLWQSYQTPLSKAERDFIRSCPPLRVGYSPARKPLIWHDDRTGVTRGILPAILHKLSRESGLIFEFTPMVDPNMSVNDYFKQGKIDLCAGVMYSATTNSSAYYTLTSPLLRSGLNLYSKKFSAIPPGEPLRVAIPATWRGGRVYLNANFPDLRVLTYPDTVRCLEAVTTGEADLLLQTSFEVDYLLARPRFREIFSLQEHSGFEDFRLAVSATMPRCLLSILNKLLMNLDEKSKSQIISENISVVAAPMSLSDVIYEHRILLAALGQMLTFGLIFYVYLAYMRRKSSKTMQESARRLTNMANNINGGVISLINNPRLDIRNANSGFWLLLGYNDKPFVNPCLSDFLSPEESENLFQLLESRRKKMLPSIPNCNCAAKTASAYRHCCAVHGPTTGRFWPFPSWTAWWWTSPSKNICKKSWSRKKNATASCWSSLRILSLIWIWRKRVSPAQPTLSPNSGATVSPYSPPMKTRTKTRWYTPTTSPPWRKCSGAYRQENARFSASCAFPQPRGVTSGAECKPPASAKTTLPCILWEKLWILMKKCGAERNWSGCRSATA